jgi:hypothetical protein
MVHEARLAFLVNLAPLVPLELQAALALLAFKGREASLENVASLEERVDQDHQGSEDRLDLEEHKDQLVQQELQVQRVHLVHSDPEARLERLVSLVLQEARVSVAPLAQ